MRIDFLKLLLSCTLLLGAAHLLTAQSFPKTVKRYGASTDYVAAQTAFERFRNHPKHRVAARYYSAKMALRQGADLAELLDLNRDLLTTAAQYRTLSAKRMRRNIRKYQVDSTGIEALREQAQRLALSIVRVRGTFGALDSLETGLTAPIPGLQTAIDSTHSDIVQAHLETKDYDIMTLIVQKHLRWVKPEHYRLTRRIYSELWAAFLDKYPLCQMDRYARDHPGSFVGRDCWRKEAQRLFCAADPVALLDFHARVPWTALESTVLNALVDTPPDPGALSPEARQHVKDLRRRTALREALRSGAAAKDTAATLQEIKYYVSQYAPRFSAFKLLEESLQFLLERRYYTSAHRLLSEVRDYFPDTLPKGCNTNFSFQLRVRPYIDGKLPILIRPGAPLTRKPLDAVNTEMGEESNPVLSADGQTLYFAGAGRPDNVASGQDIFVSYRQDGQGWGTPVLVPELSGAGNQIPLSLTADGQQLLLAVNGSMYLSRKQSGGTWSAPEKMPLSGIAQIGKGFLSADGNILVLEGSYETGGPLQAPDQDLFVTFREKTGQWSRPFALGSDINTDEQERSPFLSSDGKTLYFVTDGYPGLGRSDVFVSRRLNDKWTQWTRPDNLGKEINNTFDHSGFGHVRPDGKTAYFTWYDENGGKADIWIQMLEE